jgi:hypothetical protein
VNAICRKYEENFDGALNYFQAKFYMGLFGRHPEKYGDFVIGWFRRVQTHGEME